MIETRFRAGVAFPAMPTTKKDDPARWLAVAQTVESTANPLTIPYEITLKEAAQSADFVDAYWEPQGTRPGLSSVAKRLPHSTAADLRSLIHAVQDAQTNLLLLVDPIVIDQGERARTLIDELASALEFLLDDGVQEPADDQLVSLRDFHAQDGQRSSALAQSLNDYATLADTLRDRLVEVDTSFDPAWIDEARKLAKALSTSASKPAASAKEIADATALRNRLLTLMQQRVASVRKAARRVFRKQPELIRQVTSAYERRRRAERRAKQASEATAPATPPTA